MAVDRSLLIVIDNFSYRSLAYDNVTLFDYGILDQVSSIDNYYDVYTGQFSGYGNYDDTIVTATYGEGFYQVTPDSDSWDNATVDLDLLNSGSFTDSFGYTAFYDEFLRLTTLGQDSETSVNHGDWVVEAINQTLDNSAFTEILAIDIDLLNGYILKDLFSTVNYVFDGISYVGSALEKIIYDFYQLNDSRFSESSTENFALAGISMSISGAAAPPDANESAVLDFLASMAIPFFQSAPNVNNGYFDWSTFFQDVISVGAWNQNNSGDLLVGSETSLLSIDIVADGIIEKSGWGSNFGTSFATPKVAAEWVNALNSAIEALNASGSDLASFDPPNLENFDYTNFVSSIVDFISTPVSATINGEVVEPISVLRSTISENGYLPTTFATDQPGLPLSVSQASLYAENNTPTGSVTVTGTASEGEVLTANTSALADADGRGTLIYQWKADGTDITDATASTYSLTQDEVGKTITVAVSYTDGEGTSESVLSAASAAVTNVNDAPTGGVSITGTAAQGQVLTADASGLADQDGLGAFNYMWKADGTPISGATSSTYTLTQAEVGKTITVTASYTDGGGTAESVTSDQTARIGSINQAPIVKFDINAFSFNLTDTESVAIFDTSGPLTFTGSASATVSYTYVVPDPSEPFNAEILINSSGLNLDSVNYSGKSVDLNELNFVFGESFDSGAQVIDGVVLGFNDLEEALAGSLPDRIAFFIGESAPTVTTEEDFDSFLALAMMTSEILPLAVEPQKEYLVSDIANITISHPVAIFGNLIVGSDLMVSVADWIDPDGTSNATFSYQWQADGIDISGATLSTFTLTQAQVGKVITVAVSYTDDEGTPEKVFSESSTPVTNTNDPDVSLSLSTTLINSFGDALFNVDVSAYEVKLGEGVYLREVGTSDTSSMFEIVAKPTEAVSSIDFELVDNAGLVDFQVGSALSAWSIQTNTTTPDVVQFAGFGAVNGSTDLLVGQEVVLASFETSLDPDFVIDGIFLNTTAQADISVGEVVAVSEVGNVTVHQVARGSDVYLDADKPIDDASDRAITANDALQALRLAVGLTKSDDTAEWHDYLAADINKDGQVTANDALNILKFAVGLTDGPSADWVFVDGDADWSAIGRRNTNYEEGIWLEDVVADMSVNMTGILVGDVNGSYVA